MPEKLISCISLPPATITSVPINDFATADKEFAQKDMETYIIHAVERVFVWDVFIPSIYLETMRSVRFAMPIKITKQMKNELEK
jgi:hypothetical protein